MRALLLALVLLLAGGAVASPLPRRMARRRTAELAVAKPPECAALSVTDFQSAWQLVDDKCPKEAPFLCATTSDCWKGMEALGYKCGKAAARAAANGTDGDAAVSRIKNLYRSNPTAMINWEKDERPVPVPSPPPSPPSPSPPAEPSPSPSVGNETAGNETAATQGAAGTNETQVVEPATTLPTTGNATNDATQKPGSTLAAEQAAAKKKQEEAAAAKKQQEEAALAAAKKKQEEAAAAAAAAAAQQAAAQAAAAAAAKKRSPSPKPKVPPSVKPSPAPKTPTTPGAIGGTHTRAQVATHNTATNCWYINKGKVYNVTPYLTTSRHPGGNAVIVRYCGKDATGAFDSAHSSGPAVAQQEAYVIGTLAA